MADQWFLNRGGKEYGPYHPEQMARMAGAGQLKPNDLVRLEGDDAWELAQTAANWFPSQIQSTIPAPAPSPRAGDRNEPRAPKKRPIPAAADKLEGFWYAIIWGSLLVPVAGSWLIVILSSVMYYVWRSDFPRKARTINAHGFMAWGTGQALCCGFFALISVLGSTGGRGTELTFNQGQLFYTSNVTRAEAERLGAFLVREKFFDGTPKTVQINKAGNTYEFRMVVKAGFDRDEAYAKMVSRTGKAISTQVFLSSPLVVHLCDDKLKTLRVVLPLEGPDDDFGTELKFNNGQLFYTANVTKAEATRLGEFLVREKFFDGTAKSIQLNKAGNRYEFRMVVKQGFDKNEAFAAQVQQFARQTSKNVFASALMDVHLCNEQLKTLRVIPALP